MRWQREDRGVVMTRQQSLLSADTSTPLYYIHLVQLCTSPRREPQRTQMHVGCSTTFMSKRTYFAPATVPLPESELATVRVIRECCLLVITRSSIRDRLTLARF